MTSLSPLKSQSLHSHILIKVEVSYQHFIWIWSPGKLYMMFLTENAQLRQSTIKILSNTVTYTLFFISNDYFSIQRCLIF